jgi:hypothetical protein
MHWLEKEKLGELIWRQSQRYLQPLRKYIDAHKSHSYAISNLDKLLITRTVTCQIETSSYTNPTGTDTEITHGTD